ncbi:MAG TPA: SGNH/GDSL hydrolase family protein [Phycisphaerae bacterium]|nr:SGNH/GDSL hydrolase family protein [Phycisphaerae bacterium]HOB73229.1 SGNH/GDSL hydrolase family protein [Phycisphaerae bacterium]HOJ54863.1 SGNH/GDSL hydrolase family protein [Phycisphaerae bacterium]HOL26049.1 SGNH/GDSL hydrolase family protein [Phycisphaerae bacterium]HPP21503.1 SGNH/GDSL hydrolase family protein [Phycisphaerae bacterium]
MRTQAACRAVGPICLLLTAAGGCGPMDLLGLTDDGGAVFILDVERLASPTVTEPGLYRPEFVFPIDPNDPSSPRAAGFFLEIAADAPERLEMRALGGPGVAPTPLKRISPLAGEALASPTGWDLPEEARTLLLDGVGVFWLDAPPRRGRVLYQRVGVVLPDTWSGASITLDVCIAPSPTGAVMPGAHIELARDFFYMAAIGDSVMWGNGLREPDKFSRRVAAEIERRTGRRVVLQVHAISGVRIVPSPEDVICRVRCNGEVQTATTSVTAQVDLLEAPERLELVLMDGCINDVGLLRILNTDTQPEALAELTHQFCHDEMLKLLDKTRLAAPAAKIVVTGYYDIVSLESRLPELAQYILASGVDDDPSGLGAAPEIAEQTRLFREIAHASLSAAVEETNAAAAEPARIAFVDPGFGPQNALFASETLLWGLTADRIQQAAANEGLTLFPEDPLADLRATGCFNNRLVNPLGCLYASVGHPNPAGAKRYAEAIIPVLEQFGVIPAAELP